MPDLVVKLNDTPSRKRNYISPFVTAIVRKQDWEEEGLGLGEGGGKASGYPVVHAL